MLVQSFVAHCRVNGVGGELDISVVSGSSGVLCIFCSFRCISSSLKLNAPPFCSPYLCGGFRVRVDVRNSTLRDSIGNLLKSCSLPELLFQGKVCLHLAFV